MSNEDQPKCPVDISTRNSWLSRLTGKNKEPISTQSPQPESITEQPACPVDHNARSVWANNVSVKVALSEEAIEVSNNDTTCDSTKLKNTLADTTTTNVNLPTERELSSIPRTASNSNWVYPSQKQFFEAMQRKNWNPDQDDMKVIVPLHNIVNERAWRHILMWEQPYSEETNLKCGGIALTSFKGDSKKLTPRAWIRSLMGYEKPFDRHDWKINRCGVEVDYVIDFYAGENSQVNLDVRPKLNNFEGIKMRVFRAFGY
ncbi:Holocytochrome-c1 synthase [Candida tropicalis]